MSTETNGSSSVDEYCAAVRAELADLPDDVRDELLEDLPDHLAEVLADGDGPLVERVGEPAAYAAELRAAAGLDPAAAGSGTVQAGLSRVTQRLAEAARRFDVSAGRLVGFARLADLRRALRPGWWVLRGWIVTVFICSAGNSEHRDLFPQLSGNHLLGGVALVAIVAASVWFGQRSLTFSAWPRGLVIAFSALVAVWAITALPGSFNGDSYAYVPASGPAAGYPDVSDVYVYDQAGNPVSGARLFDQNGNPIQLGAGFCQDGNPAPGAVQSPDAFGNEQAWTYPLCPSDPGPFRSGPGAAPAPPASATISGAPSSSAPSSSTPSSGAPSSSASSGPATRAPKDNPIPTATPTR